MSDLINPSKEEYERVGMKKIFPLEPGHLVPPWLDPAFKNIANDKMTRAYIAKLICLVIPIDFNYLLDKMVIVSNNTQEGSLNEHHNEQDVVVSFDNMRINVEVSMNNKDENIRKNLITWLKQAGNMYKVSDGYRTPRICHQICIENYNAFNNDLLVTEAKLVDVSTGNYEVLTDDYIQYHVNLNNLRKVCYNELSEIEKYYTLLTLDEEDKLLELCQGDEILMDTVDKLKIMSNDTEFITSLENKQIEEYCHKIALEDAEEKGKQEGKAEGKKDEKLEIAKKMLDDGFDTQTIIKYTSLSIDEIKNLN